MILAIDGGIATFGWAVVRPRTGEVVACGVLLQEPDPKLTKHDDRVRRVKAQSYLLDELIRTWQVTELAAEEMSFAPRGQAAAKIGIGMSFGNVIGMAVAYSLRLTIIPPKTWQRAIVPAEPGENPRAAIPYERVAAALASFVDLRATGLDQIAKGQRNHAMDAIGIGVYAALRPVIKTTTTHATTGATP